jgi:hypothetical protein
MYSRILHYGSWYSKKTPKRRVRGFIFKRIRGFALHKVSGSGRALGCVCGAPTCCMHESVWAYR